MTTDLLAELEWRGLKYQHTAGLAEQLAAGRVSAYCGFDPTADSLHVGSLVQLMGLSHLHRAGHRPVVLVGGGTGLIGDPSGKANERPLADQQTIEANTQKIAAQIGRFLAFDLVNNAEWLTSLNLVEFLRDVGKHFTVNYMLQKDSVNARMEAGISFTEFSYMLLQAYDFLELYRRQGVTLQIGGSDQWGNITAGIELIRRTTGAEAHALTLPLVTNAAGTKFGKTESGTIWLDPAKTSPYQFYQFWINIDDRDVGRYLRYFTLLTRDEIEALEREIADHPERREAQRALARDVTTRVHGKDATQSAEAISSRLFSEEFTSLTAVELDWLYAEIGVADRRRESTQVGGVIGITIPRAPKIDPVIFEYLPAVLDLLVEHQLVSSKGDGRRQLQQGAIYLNNKRLAADRKIVESDLLHDRYLLLRRGPRTVKLVRFEQRTK